MKRIVCALLLTMVLISLAIAINGRFTIPTRTVRLILPLDTEKVPPFAAPDIDKADGANVTASVDRNTGRVWMAAVGDIVPVSDQIEVLFKGKETRAIGSARDLYTGKLVAVITLDIPADGFARSSAAEMYVVVEIVNSAGNTIQVESAGIRGDRAEIPINMGGTDQTVQVTSVGIPAAGNYTAKAGFKLRSAQNVYSALYKNVKIKKIHLYNQQTLI